ncbi:C4-dicarboxylate ABC transporter [Nocardioides sp. Leaf285]|uniref:SLAC1 family transporter n=1 Tax=Nocardioides sp. Leaf285 TaxID=1736322 RepID=UPI0012EAC3D4|nr:C4-dicarboxylate ABC transporter [Nocardioides sp. Leaf285]
MTTTAMSPTETTPSRSDHAATTAAGSVGPNWFASVMGTGILAVALTVVPVAVPGRDLLALAAWLVAAVLLVVLTAASVAQSRRHPGSVRAHLADPVMAHFFGAPAMALMTVGAGALLVGHRVLGVTPALALGASLWVAGTLLGLATTVVVPTVALVSHRVGLDDATPSWLMPVVPPMVSAATGALLVPHVPAGDLRAAFLLCCWGLAGVALAATLVVLPLVLRRLRRHGLAATAAPTLLIVLGPLGQSVTAVHHLGALSPAVLPRPWGAWAAGAVVPYGALVLALAMAWLVVAGALVVRTARRDGGLPFSLAWWAFTFPVGTVVTGSAALAEATGSTALLDLAVVLLATLATLWLVVAVRTTTWLLAR